MADSDGERDDVPLLGPLQLEGWRSQLQLKDYVAAVVAVCMVGLGVTAIALVYNYQTEIIDEYSIVLDAGSTHTDLMVYKWTTKDVLQGTALVKQIGSCMSTGGSISSYASTDPNKAGSSLEGCIRNTAEKLIPTYLQAKSPIYLGATAGMRLVRETDTEAADQIMKSVQHTLHASPFKFQDEQARIISGDEEGLSSWVTVNYLRGGLLYRGILSNSSVQPTAHLQGALDMGGASTQITFPLHPGVTVPQKYTKYLHLYGRRHRLYTHSYLCYGNKEAERRYMFSLLKNSSMAAIVDNPCAPEGLVENRTVQYLLQPPCVDSHIPSSNQTFYTFRGTGNVTECSSKVARMFNFSSCFGSTNCSFDGVFQPSTEDTKFVAFSSYYYVAHSLNLTSASPSGNISLAGLKRAADKFCSEPWAEVDTGNSPKQFLKTLCFDAQYIFTLLTQGYHLNENSSDVSFQNSIHGRSLGWALGFMINATNLLPINEPTYRVQTEAFMAVVIVAAILISLGVLLAITATRRAVNRKKMSPRGLAI
ncbi:ectonucleoside triphosphate diphosphohydrolase 8 [Nematostella vectensis]|uniref:ectonucleoside triphosphate diphosphohydrolase 8 n=1 Tax=Nematostella vectensis TaxID=45351 RepID=UPI002076E5A3|nr:ectonucleoside triphosphate diphosphohydrolase 8 [Nematostella vectensis]